MYTRTHSYKILQFSEIVSEIVLMLDMSPYSQKIKISLISCTDGIMYLCVEKKYIYIYLCLWLIIILTNS